MLPYLIPMASRLNLFGVPPVLVDGENYHELREPSAQARRDRPGTGRSPTGSSLAGRSRPRM
jgi:hypothetical protein